MGPIPPVAFRENDPPRYEDDIMANDDVFRENINLEDEDDIMTDDGAFRENIYVEDEDGIILNDDVFRGNIYLEDENEHTIVNSSASYNFQDEDNSILNSNERERDFRRNNENEDNELPFYMLLFTPTLECIKNVLYVALHPFFDEFEIAVVSCPCLTRPPYNLAADGLSSNTGILHMGGINNLSPIPRTDLIFDIQYILSRYCYDVFVIGSGYATKPFMPYNGHLTINAIVSENPTNVINNSCISYEDASTGLNKLKIINDPNQMKCSMLGTFFFSEGRRGMVIKMRIKGQKTTDNIIMLIQKCLNVCYQYPIGLGVVLVINGGQTLQFITPEYYPIWFSTHTDFYKWLKYSKHNCTNLITVGALTNSSFINFGQNSDGNGAVTDLTLSPIMKRPESFAPMSHRMTQSTFFTSI
ncbi:ester hydrolase C11orf54 homolog isoform X2 [Formica exsecta]|uniref:ester hydrolase C11orf54 homolog isoform X2 n=1 Tax=Formica exsecta TaxID=72781 RepID=UPI0011416FC4|nr:ester hydrolase C11orf54 homolog isoform X2 [Formica exsecta]